MNSRLFADDGTEVPDARPERHPKLEHFSCDADFCSAVRRVLDGPLETDLGAHALHPEDVKLSRREADHILLAKEPCLGKLGSQETQPCLLQEGCRSSFRCGSSYGFDAGLARARGDGRHDRGGADAAAAALVAGSFLSFLQDEEESEVLYLGVGGMGGGGEWATLLIFYC